MNYQRFDDEEEEDMVMPPKAQNEEIMTEVRLDQDGVDVQIVSSDKHVIRASSGTNGTFYDTEAQQGGPQHIEDPAGDRYTAETPLEHAQLMVRKVVEHIIFRLVTMVLILIDIVLVIVDISITTDSKKGFDVVALIFSCYFMTEVIARIFGRGPKLFFKNWVDVVDFVVVLIAFIFTPIYTALDLRNLQQNAELGKLVIAGRLIRGILIIRIIYTERKNVAKASRLMVSENKRRYQKDGFDLDLCYVTERVIAMSFPSTGIMSVYRNPIQEVARFFDTKHKDHYKIYNLCSERGYDETLFHNRVERVYIDDHNVPELKDMITFAKSVEAWMNEDQNNIIAVHCKGGKGRTGTMICTWLVHCGLFEQAHESLDYFGRRRTDQSVGSKFQGVETPSQSRYVGYFEKIKKNFNEELPPDKRLRMTQIKITGITGVGNGDGSDLSMMLFKDKVERFNCQFGTNTNCKLTHVQEEDFISIELEDSPILVGDIKVRFTSTAKIPIGYDNCPFYFWFNTSFVEDNRLKLLRYEIDNPHKEKTWDVFREEFTIQLFFEGVDDL
ncbi:phosphatidylinositol 3,4,5-trisphosphate 3-phosphatase TPTE2 isoform X1 [Lingula anatina]|uniref:Phosphatidylinositol 3,4,5-trisphosphate 3-phosphatase TPTE2 isoform X1 n=2 Tax=Lingula anatina TaxID=7574 RepID=A0A1S3IJA1_LINAN|nr:phosphatidylinositol 3,4,5-trisphosphate 3-phosphatase TPTE2 isoform X1 [Lingula anatina]|eukprot:XP_013398292.1 phosphatidylinositol 3,4,5-trisphosphate 3-phosphatase TPTE2 isoform X1 [Lingula anatina]